VRLFKRGVSMGFLTLPQKLSEQLPINFAVYLDHVLSSFCTSQEVTTICKLIGLLDNKDVMLLHYRKCLSKRVIYDDQISLDTNNFFLTTLTGLIGNTLTHPILQVLNELQTSRVFTEKIKNLVPLQTKVNIFSLQQLFQRPLSLTLPSEIEDIWKIIITQYARIHEKRKLVLCETSSTVFLKSGKMTIEMPLPHYMIFKEGETVMNDVAKKYNIDSESLDNFCGDLESAKLITRKENSIYPVSEFKGDVIIVQMTQKKKNLPSDVIDEKAEVEEKRFQTIVGVQVRLMKRHKKITHQDLIRLTNDQVKKTFVPDSRLLRKALEYLIDNEYIERDKSDKDLLIYLS
ncbi:cullin, putative, partial [Entamoeba invadens IP1]